MTRIDAAFHRLQPVGLLQALRHERLRRRHGRKFPFGQRRLTVRWPHVGPEHAAALDQRIRLQLDLLREADSSGSDGTSMH